MNRYVYNPWLVSFLYCVIVFCGMCLVTSCSIGAAIPRPHESGAVTGNSDIATTVNRLAFIAGIAAIGCVTAGILLKQYATALVGGPALAGLALVFLLLPAIASTVKWLLIGTVVIVLGGAAWLAYSRWKAYVAIKLTAKYADRMEAAETDGDVTMAKNMARAEQVQAGVKNLIAKVREI